MALDEVYVGTSGCSYPNGTGRGIRVSYSRGFRGSDKLSFSSGCFNAVEVNVTFHRLVPPRVGASWASKTPADFRFTGKMWQKLTHSRMHQEGRYNYQDTMAEISHLGGRIRDVGQTAKKTFAFFNNHSAAQQ